MRKDRVDGSPFESEFAKMGAGQERALRPEELGGCAPVRCRRVTLSLFALSLLTWLRCWLVTSRIEL